MSRFLLDISAHRAGFALRIELQTDGPWVGVVGPSGAGKSTLLEAIAGLLPSLGTIRINDALLQDTDAGVSLTVQQRRVGYVFQGEALFPHLTVAENLEFGMGAPHDTERHTPYREVVGVLDLESLLSRRPPELSGGERRRVALGRALLRAPRLLLLDEPLAGLDPALRERVLDYLARCRARFDIPAFLVSHQLEDVLSLTDHVVIVERGSIRDGGSPHELVGGGHRAALTRLLGFENVLAARVLEVNPRAGTVTAQVQDGPKVCLPHARVIAGQVVRIGIRAEDIILASERPGPTSARNLCEGRIVSLTSRGSLMLVEIDCGIPIVAKITPASAEELSLRPGSHIWFLFKTHSCHYLEPSAAPGVPLKGPDTTDV